MAKELEELLLVGALYGRDGDGGDGDGGDGGGDGDGSGSGDGGDGGDSKGEGKKPDDSKSPADEGKGEGDTFDRAYVEGLRRENAKHRTRATEAEGKLADIEREQMSELDKAKAGEKDEKALRISAEKALASERLSNFVRGQASKFHNPQDAVDLIDLGSIEVDDDGDPNKEAVEKLLAAVAKDKPYLLKSAGKGSGDGGPQGKPDGDPSDSDKVKAERKRLIDAGKVEIPI